MPNTYLSDELRTRGLTQAPYTGFIAGRGISGYNAVANSGSPYQTMTRILYTARDTAVGPRPLLPIGWYVAQASNAETVQTGSYTTTAALEYPLGTFTQLTFNGNATGTFNGGDVAIPDAPNVTVPAGATFAIRWWLSSPNGWVYRGDFPKVTGDGFMSGTTITDLTMGGGAGAAGGLTPATTLNVAPLGVIAQTTRRAYLLIGDSIMFGGDKDSADASGNMGVGARLIGYQCAYSNAGVSSTRANQFTTANASRRIALAQYASDVLCNYGVNDTLSNVSAATTLTELTRIAALFPGKRFYQTTITPITNGSGSAWTLPDASDQVNGANVAVVDTLNDLIRVGFVGMTGFVDVKAACEYQPGSQKWRPGWTGDGVHPKPGAYRLIGQTAPGRAQLI